MPKKILCNCCKRELQPHEYGVEFCYNCMLAYSDFLVTYYKVAL